MFHDRQGDAEDVGLLECIGANRRTRHLTGDHHHGHRVHLGCSDTGHQVGGTRPRRAEANAHLAGGARIGIGRVGAGLLMPHQDVLHPTLALGDVECVVDRENRAAGVAENRVDAMAPQRIHQGCRPRHSLATVTGLLPSDGRRR